MEAITQSMLGVFLRCPHQFERRYLRGEVIPPGIAARRGSATHKAAQLNHEQKLHSQADLPVGDLWDAARDRHTGHKLQLRAHSLEHPRRLGKLAAHLHIFHVPVLYSRYQQLLLETLN